MDVVATDPLANRHNDLQRAAGRVLTWCLRRARKILRRGFTVPIAGLHRDIRTYHGQRVKTWGDVMHSVGAGTDGLFQLSDGDGSLLVFTNRVAPRPGAPVNVEGRVYQVCVADGEQVIMLIEAPEESNEETPPLPSVFGAALLMKLVEQQEETARRRCAELRNAYRCLVAEQSHD
jgi:hypothetical protein